MFSLSDLDLVDAPAEESFDNFTALATQIIGTPVSLISIVDIDGDRQFFKSQIGLIDPWATECQTPLSHSFCQHVVRNDAPLVVENAPEHPLVKNNLAIPDLAVFGYLGVPVYAPGRQPVGALCVIESKPRAWNTDDIATLKRLADCVSDVIRLKAALKAGERLRSEQRLFTDALSHDLKIPANGLKLVMHALSDAPDVSSDSKQLLDDGLSMATDLAQQIDDVLAFIRGIGANTEFQPVALRSLVESVVKEAEEEISKTSAKVEIQDLPIVSGSGSQLHLLFEKLIGNALRYTANRQTPLVVVSSEQTKHGYSISVRDNGIGIAPEHHESIFDLFTRLDTRDDYPGSGIGLTLCQRVVENHNGSISVSSTKDHGATFTIFLPEMPT